MATRRYSDYNTYLKNLFNERVQKIIVDAGLTCPNRDGTLSRRGCLYCNARGSGSGDAARGLTIRQQVQKGQEAMIRRYKARKFLAYFQSYTNTYAPLERLKGMYDEALDSPGMVGLVVGTRPDCMDKGTIDLLASYAEDYLVWVEYGLQSVHDDTLKLINRGHGFAAFEQSVSLTRTRPLHICAHVILGLPGESRQMMLETARIIGEMGIDGVKIHLLYVIRGTGLESMFIRGGYRCMEQEDYVDTVCDFIELLPPNCIIQRITGDPHPDELVAPEWALRKNDTFRMIQQALEVRDSWQGKGLGFANPYGLTT